MSFKMSDGWVKWYFMQIWHTHTHAHIFYTYRWYTQTLCESCEKCRLKLLSYFATFSYFIHVWIWYLYGCGLAYKYFVLLVHLVLFWQRVSKPFRWEQSLIVKWHCLWQTLGEIYFIRSIISNNKNIVFMVRRQWPLEFPNSKL